MNPIEKLTEKERIMIENYIIAYSRSSDDYGVKETLTDMAPLDHILRIWNDNKQHLFEIFGENLILQKHIDYEKSVDELSDEIFNKMTNWRVATQGTFIWNFNNFAQREYEDRLSETYSLDTFWNLRDLVDCGNLAKNIWDGEEFTIYHPSLEKPIVVKKGSKIIRTLGKLAEAFNIDGFEQFRIDHSMILNKKKLSGNLVISIHPLDFMTMSDNTCRWSSCMSWNDYGEYRQGTVEMMNSNTVIVAYLTSGDDMIMPGNSAEYTWNSKKWRQLFVCSPDIITGIKPYPYFNDTFTEIILDWLKELYEATFPQIVHFYNKPVQFDAECNFLFEGSCEQVYLEFTTDNMYNDTTNTEYMIGYLRDDMSGTNYIYYSGPSECMWCGDTYGPFADTDELVCESCYVDPAARCYCCDSIIRHREDIYCVDGEDYCQYCYENNTFEDDFTGEIHGNDSERPIYFSPDNEIYYSYAGKLKGFDWNIEHGEHLSKYFKRIRMRRSGYSTMLYYCKEDLTQKGLESFGYRTEFNTDRFGMNSIISDYDRRIRDVDLSASISHEAEKSFYDWLNHDYSANVRKDIYVFDECA